MAKIIQQVTDCKETRSEPEHRVPQKVKTWLLNIECPDGEAWAIVNAPSVNMAQGVFLRQTKLTNPKILQLKELRYFGQEWQICYEGMGHKCFTHNHY